MTREEAITVLKAFMENPLFSEVHKAAFNIAIHDIKAYQDWNINNLILVNKDNYEPTTKNDLGVDCVLRADAIRVASGYCHPSNVAKELAKLPSVVPQGFNSDKNELEFILDEIRVEIEMEKLEDSPNSCIKAHNNAVERVLQIIDKHKADRCGYES